MKIAITGVSGYLGGLMLRRLDADSGVSSILGLDVIEPQFTSSKFIFRKADVRTANFESLFQGCDVVYHLAYIVEPLKNTSMRTIDEINVEGSRRVFEGAIAAGVPKIIFSGSTAAYGAHADNPDQLTEDAPLRPNNDWYYSRSKGRAESILDDLSRRSPKTIIIRLRPCIFLGPGINNSMGTLFASPILICLRRNVRIDFCWIDDVADAFHLALRHNASGAFNLAGDGPMTVNEMGRLSGRPVLHVHHGATVILFRLMHALGVYAPGAVEWIQAGTAHSINVSSEKAKQKLGWTPRYDAAGAYLEFLKHAHRKQRPAERASRLAHRLMSS